MYDRRTTVAQFETRKDEVGNITRISGYGSIFFRPEDDGSRYMLWEDAEERIMPGAFDKTDMSECRGLFNHDPDNLLGSVAGGNMELTVDEIGLRYSIEFDPTDPDHQRVAAKIDRGDLTGSSFGFTVAAENWRSDGGREIREIKQVGKLFDVGPVTFPAYTGTSANTRDSDVIEAAEDSYKSWTSKHSRSQEIDIKVNTIKAKIALDKMN